MTWPFSSADIKTAFFFTFRENLKIDFVSTDFLGAIQFSAECLLSYNVDRRMLVREIRHQFRKCRECEGGRNIKTQDRPSL